MTMREARRGWFVPLLAASLVVGTGGWASAQEDPAAVAARVHAEGAYPDDISVLEDEADTTTLDGDDPSGGGGAGPHGSVHPNGERDGGDASRTLDLPLPDFVRDMLNALGRMIGAAASTLTWVLFALGLALIAVFVVYLVTLFRFPKRDLTTLRREHRPDGMAMSLDPLLEESLSSPEEYARQGRFREAIHAVFVRSLSEMARAGDVDRRGRTAREVVTAIARIQHAPPELGDLLSLAELVWFGGRPATETQYVQAVDLAARLRSSAGGGPGGQRGNPSPRPEAP